MPTDNKIILPTLGRSKSPFQLLCYVIVIVGENRSFDPLFATYVPSAGVTVNMIPLLSTQQWQRDMKKRK